MERGPGSHLFNSWADKYDRWFESPMGRLIRTYERDLVLQLLKPGPGETILDAGCGTGIFTGDVLDAGASLVGVEISATMGLRAKKKLASRSFRLVRGDMLQLPFADQCFDHAMSITAIEFIRDAGRAVLELLRVTKCGGRVLVATLNSLNPWNRRRAAADKGHPLFKEAVFRSPEDVLCLTPLPGTVKTAVHFDKQENPDRARQLEQAGRSKGSMTGAFLAACWKKPSP